MTERALERARRRRGAIEFVAELRPWFVYGHEAGLERAVLNVLDNAAKWSPAGAQVLVTMREAGRGLLELAVDDAGPGIPSDERELVFERFYRSSEARSRPGSGLGLAIVKHAAEQHGGMIYARNAPGAGAQFTLWLPRLAGPVERREPDLAAAQATRVPRAVIALVVGEHDRDHPVQRAADGVKHRHTFLDVPLHLLVLLPGELCGLVQQVAADLELADVVEQAGRPHVFDPLGVEALSAVIGELAATGTAVMFSSHQLDLVEDVCEDVVIIARGRVVAAGEALIAPGVTRRLIAAFTRHDPAATGGRVSEALRRIRADFGSTGDPTRLAYVYYGDARLRLVTPEGATSGRRE